MKGTQRIHVLGASGAGTSTLGRAVAERLGAPFLDTDDFYWLPTDPPYREPRAVAERLDLLGADLRRIDGWVLSGSLCGWGDVFVPMFELVLFLETPRDIRIARLRARERERYGAAALQPGGTQHVSHEAFIAWASSYDDGGVDTRSKLMHEQWLERLPPRCDVLRLDGALAVSELTDSVSTAVAWSPPREPRRV